MIEARQITKSFDNLQVLKGIDLTVEQGEIVSVVGPSGAGKTTLLQILGTLDRPDSGSLLFDGENPLAMKADALARFRNRTIGFVFQFHQLLPEFSLIENVALPALIGGLSRKEAFSRARELAGYMGLLPRADHRPAQLSGGERQRAAVARALVCRPKVILADEPSGSLDSRNRAELHKLFFDLRRDMGQTFVIVTHDENLAADADRRIMMADGRITGIDTRPQPLI
ncbi:MAG: ABC transporter ATP-binding protein [Paramuribaculum sp.]|nr:ABC transporter ATP-binding protein [Paramuribaculum sp.]